MVYYSLLLRYSRFTVDVVVARRPGFYTVKIVGPFFLIVLMSLSMFAMDVSSLNDRVSTGIEAALTATAFQLLCAEALPKISYLTALDVFIYMYELHTDVLSLCGEIYK